MICILHGYGLEGSGSNLWTRSVLEALCRGGEDVHVVCQDSHPENYPFISEAFRWPQKSDVETLFHRKTDLPGKALLHIPDIGDALPVYVGDRYPGFGKVAPMTTFSNDAINVYLDRNFNVVSRIVEKYGIKFLHANHTVLMSVVAQRVSERLGIAYGVMPHGSCLEYAVKKDKRFLDFGKKALQNAEVIFVESKDIRERLQTIYPNLDGLEKKMKELTIGVDTSKFVPINRPDRPNNITKLIEQTQKLRTGKTLLQSRSIASALSSDQNLEYYKNTLHSLGDYSSKFPDADFGAKMEKINWKQDEILLFVGRLIAAKGPQTILAALPLILEQKPNLKTLFVGHGPLREVLEAFVVALRNGDRRFLQNILDRASPLESTDTQPYFSGLHQFYEDLQKEQKLERYFKLSQAKLKDDSVIFTGYLSHPELSLLVPCVDAACFPSIVPESGPMVFLEALSSGVVPMGPYIAGIQANIDRSAKVLSPDLISTMKLDPRQHKTITDLIQNAPRALALSQKAQNELHQFAKKEFDWKNVADNLSKAANI